jgi:hypothetical protein
MATYKVLTAAVLLTSFWEPETPEIPAAYEAWAPAVRTLALSWEILDQRETSELLTVPARFATDLHLLQERLQDLRDAPALAEADRFPTKEVANEMLALNRAYRQELTLRLEIDTVHREELQVALWETDQLYQVWDAVRDARSRYCFVFVRRQALKRLRELLGPEAFCVGQLPPCVPVWRFPNGY